MEMKILPLGAYQANCYLVFSRQHSACAVIDPGDNARQILQAAQQENKQITDILLTHGHFDHVGAVKDLAAATGCRVWLCQGDYSQPKDPLHRYFYPLSNCLDPEIQLCEEGQKIPVGALEFTVLHTPGHSHGSVCYLCRDCLFTGDTLFAGSCGRTDLPGGHQATLVTSLRRLRALAGDYRVFPGHGESSTLAAERQFNPYLR